MDLDKSMKFYEKLFARSGPKLVDTSIVRIFNSSRQSDYKKTDCLDFSAKYYTRLREYIKEGVYFSDESIEELSNYLIKLRRLGRRLQKTKHLKKTTRKHFASDEGKGIDQRLIGEHYRNLATRLRGFINTMQNHRVETCLDDDWERLYLPIVMEVSKKPGVKRVSNSKYFFSHGPSPDFVDNDEKIFAKALSLSNITGKKVSILTCDGDFLRMQMELRRDMRRLSERNGVQLMRSDFEVVYYFRDVFGNIKDIKGKILFPI